MVALAILMALLPALGDPEFTLMELVLAYVLLLGVVTRGCAATGASLSGCLEELIESSAVRPLALLFVADAIRMVAVMCVELSFTPASSPTGDSPAH